jgi:hypothetical protein
MKILYPTLLFNGLQAGRPDLCWLDLHRSEHGTTTVLLQSDSLVGPTDLLNAAEKDVGPATEPHRQPGSFPASLPQHSHRPGRIRRLHSWRGFRRAQRAPLFIPIEPRDGAPPSAKRWSTPKPMPAAALVTTAIRSWKGENLCHYSTREA